jgi:hypothetical protein
MASEDAHQFLAGKSGGTGDSDAGEPRRLAGGTIGRERGCYGHCVVRLCQKNIYTFVCITSQAFVYADGTGWPLPLSPEGLK